MQASNSARLLQLFSRHFMIAYVFKPKRRKNGKLEAGRIYRARFRLDGDFAISEVSMETSDKQVAEKKLREIIAEKERERAGLLAPKLQRDSAQKPISAHLVDFLADLASMGRTPKYRHDIDARVTRLLGDCSWKHLNDITGDSFIAWRSMQTRLAPKTLNEFHAAINALLHWLERQGRIQSNPLHRIPKVDTRGKQGKKRAFSDEEFVKLMAVAGRHRVLYLTAAYTGLRLGELRQLVWADLKLEHKRPHLVARAATTKNRREALIPIHPELLEELRKAKPAGVDDGKPVFYRCANADRRIQRDIRAAGIQRIDALGRKLCFHSLRYSFATKLASNGVSQRLAQELMRHSDPRLTASIYTDTTKLPAFDAVYELPWLAPSKELPSEKARTQSSQIDSQNPGAGGQNESPAGTETRPVNSSEIADTEGGCAALALAVTAGQLAERVGFEPTVGVTLHLISSQAR